MSVFKDHGFEDFLKSDMGGVKNDTVINTILNRGASFIFWCASHDSRSPGLLSLFSNPRFPYLLTYLSEIVISEPDLLSAFCSAKSKVLLHIFYHDTIIVTYYLIVQNELLLPGTLMNQMEDIKKLVSFYTVHAGEGIRHGNPLHHAYTAAYTEKVNA